MHICLWFHTNLQPNDTWETLTSLVWVWSCLLAASTWTTSAWISGGWRCFSAAYLPSAECSLSFHIFLLARSLIVLIKRYILRGKKNTSKQILLRLLRHQEVNMLKLKFAYLTLCGAKKALRNWEGNVKRKAKLSQRFILFNLFPQIHFIIRAREKFSSWWNFDASRFGD